MKTNQNVAGRLVGIQFARAIAAIAVMFGHVASEFGPLGLPSPFRPFNEGAAGVDLFFVVSGFVIVLSSEKLLGQPDAPLVFLARRLARIAPLWWASIGAMLLAYSAFYSSLSQIDQSARSVIASLFFYPYPRPGGGFYPVIPQGWTLYFEMLFYGIFTLALLTSRKMGHVVAVASTMLLAAAILFYLGFRSGPLAFWANPIMIEFIFGMVVCLLYLRGWRIPVPLALAFVVFGLAVLFRPGSSNNGWVSYERQIEWGLPATFAIAGLALGRWQEGPTWLARPVALLGDASYALYLTHAMIFWIVRANFAVAIDPAAHPYLFALALLTTAIVAAIVIFLLFERPTTRILQAHIANWRGQPSRSVKPEWRRLVYGAFVVAITWSALHTMPAFESRPALLQKAAQSATDPEKAIALYGEAIALTPNNPALFFLRGSALLANKKPQLAANDFAAGLQLDPNNVTLKSLLDQALAQGATANALRP